MDHKQIKSKSAHQCFPVKSEQKQILNHAKAAAVISFPKAHGDKIFK